MLAVTCAVAATAANTFDIRERGAKGDGQTLDTAAIQAALDAGRDAGGGQVRFPPGRYLSGTIHFRSGVAPHLDAGARLIGTTNLAHYAQPTPPAFVPEAKWGKRHRGLFTGENVQDVAITGPGTMDGNKVFDPKGEERMRGAYTIAFVNCRRFTLRDVTIVDAANYAVFFQMSDDVEIRNVKFVGGWDGGALARRAGALVPEREHHRLSVLHQGRRHRGSLLEQHGHQGLPHQLVMQRHPSLRPGHAPDHREQSIPQPRRTIASRLRRAAPHQHALGNHSPARRLGRHPRPARRRAYRQQRQDNTSPRP